MGYHEKVEKLSHNSVQSDQSLSILNAEISHEIIDIIKDVNSVHRDDSLRFLVYNTLPGTTGAAGVKAQFLREIIIAETAVPGISPALAFEQLLHMKMLL